MKLHSRWLALLAFIAAPLALQAGAPTFDPFALIKCPDRANHMVMGDFDGDGIPDVAVLGSQGAPQGIGIFAGHATVFFGDGAGGFKATTASIQVTSNSSNFDGVAAGRVFGHSLNGNPISDLVFTTGANVQVFEWNGTAFLGTTVGLTGGISATKVVVGDVTGAGHQDIVASDDFGSVGIVVVPNDGAGGFTSSTPVKYAAGGCDLYAVPVLVDHFVNDAQKIGHADVILSHLGHVGVLVNKGDGTFNTEVNYGYAAQPTMGTHGVAVADVDGDGKPDIVTVGSVGNSPTTWYLGVNLGNGDGSFGAGTVFPFTDRSGQNIIDRPVIAAADLNNDGRAEVVTLTDAPGTLQSNPITAFTVTRFTGTGAGLSIEGQDDYPVDFIPYDSIVLGYDDGGTFTTFNNDPSVDVLVGTAVQISDNGSFRSQFLVYQNTSEAGILPLDPPDFTVNGSTDPSVITPGAVINFAATESSTAVGLYVRVQAAQTNDPLALPEEKDWTDLNTGNSGRMLGTNGIYTLNTPAYPTGANVFFRAIAAAPGYEDGISDPVGPFTLQQALSISISATTTTDPVEGKAAHANDVVTYTLTVKNAAGAPRAENLHIRDLCPVFTGKDDLHHQVLVLGGDINNGGVLNYDTVDLQGNPATAIEWNNLPPLDGGTQLSVSFTVRLSFKYGNIPTNVPRQDSSLFNTVFTASSATGKPQGVADGFTAPSRILVEPKSGVSFTLETSADPAPGVIGLGAMIRYTMTYGNEGSSDATNVVLSADIPKGTKFVDGDTGVSQSGKKVLFNLGTVGAFRHGDFKSFRVRVTDDAQSGSVLSGTATLTAGKTKESAGLPTYRVVAPLQLTLSADPLNATTAGSTCPNGAIRYTLAYKNVSPSAVNNVTMSAAPPANARVDLTDISSGQAHLSHGKLKSISWALGTLASGEAGTRTFLVNVDGDISVGQTISTTATLKADVKDVPTITATSPVLTVVSPLEITLTPALVPVPLRPGDGALLQFTVRNRTGFALNNVTISEHIPTGTHFVTASDGGQRDPVTGYLTWNLGTLNPGSSRFVTFEVVVDYDVELGSELFNGNPLAKTKGLQLDIDQNGFSVTADDPVSGKAKAVLATGATAYNLRVGRTEPTDRPILALAQTATADGQLRQDNTTGNLPPKDLGDIATVVMPPSPADNLNGQITYHFQYSNTGTATAHNCSLDIFIPSGTTFANFYYLGPDEQHQRPVPANTLSQVRNILTLQIGDLPAGTGDIFSFKVTVDPTRRFGFIDCNGASLSSDDFFVSTKVGPDTLTTALVPPITFQAKAERLEGGTVVKNLSGPTNVTYTVTYTNNGGIRAGNVQVKCKLPAKTTPVSSTFGSDPDTHSVPGTLIFNDPNPMLAQEVRTFDLVLNFQNVPDYTKVVFQPDVTGRAVTTVRAPAPGARHTVAASAPPPVVSLPEIVYVAPAARPRLVLARRQTGSVHPGGYIVYEFAFGNSGGSDARNVKLAVAVPGGTKLANDLVDGSGNKANAVWPGRLILPGQNATSLSTNFTVRGSIVTWNLGTLPAHAAGQVRMVVAVNSNFTECSVQDHSCYISADDTPSIVPPPVSTNVRVPDQGFLGNLWRGVSCFFEGVGAQIAAALNHTEAVSAFQSLRDDAMTTVIGGSDVVETHSFSGEEGAFTLPLGGGQVLVIESGHHDAGTNGVISAAAGQIISHDGGTLIGHDGASLITEDGAGLIGHDGASIAAGSASSITVNGIDGSAGGNLTAAQLLDTCDLVAKGNGGIIQVARGGNLIGHDGASLIGHDGASLISNVTGNFVTRPDGQGQQQIVTLKLDATGIISAGGGNVFAGSAATVVSNSSTTIDGNAFGAIISAPAANGAAAVTPGPVLSGDSSPLIGHDGASLIGHDGAS